VHQFGPQAFDQLAHPIGDGFDALEFENCLVNALDFVGYYDPAVDEPHAKARGVL
jgi:hypothetical protein